MAGFHHIERGSVVEPIYGSNGLAVERVRCFEHTPLLPARERWTQWSFRIMRGGTRSMSYGERILTLAPNTVVWHAPLTAPVTLRALPGSSSDQIVLSMSARRWTAWLAQHPAFRERHAALLAQLPVLELGLVQPHVLLVIRDLLALHDALQRRAPLIEQQCTLLLQLIGALHFGRQPAAAAPERRQRVEAAQMLLAGKLDQPPSLVQLAAMLSVSPRQLQRDFIACTGITPRRYLNSIRLSQANTLLADTSLPIAAIAAQLGYVSQAHFSAAFRAVYHCSPRQVRAVLQGRVGHDEPQLESSR